MTEETLKYIISRIIDNANDALREGPVDDFSKGKRMAYFEMLDTIKNELELNDKELKDYGLDVDIAKFI